MGAGLAGAQTALAVFGLGSQIAGQAMDADAKAKEAVQNKALADQAAADAIQRGGQQAAQARTQGSQLISRQKTAFAASGVDGTTGTPMQVMADTRVMSELDAKTLENNAAREAWGFKRYGLQYQQQAQLDATRSRNQMVGTFLGGLGRIGAASGRGYEQSQGY